GAAAGAAGTSAGALAGAGTEGTLRSVGRLSITPPSCTPLTGREPTYAKAAVLIKNTTAAHFVERDKKLAAPVAPNKLPADPPPKAEPISAPLPCWSRTKTIIARAETI